MNQLKTKRMKECYKDLDFGKIYQDIDAVKILKSKSTVKFVETVDVSINLGIDAKKSDQNSRIREFGRIIIHKNDKTFMKNINNVLSKGMPFTFA